MADSVEKLALLSALGREIAATFDLGELVPKALESVARVTGSDLTMLFLREGNQMMIRGVYPPEGNFDQIGSEVEDVGKCLCGLAGAGENVYSRDILSEPDCIYDECKNAGIKSFAAVPMTVPGEILGVVSLASRTTRDFREESDFLEAAVSQIALALQNSLLHTTMVRQVEELERSIEERRRMEKALRLSESNFKKQLIELNHVYQTVPLGLCFLDTELRYVKINTELAAINGKPVEAHIGRYISEVIPEIARQVEPMYRRVIETGEPVLDFEVKGIKRAGFDQPRDWLSSYYPVKDEMGRLLGIGGVVKDITERKQAERALLASEEKYRDLVENINDAIFVADRDGKITYISRAIETIAGYAPPGLIGKSVLDYAFDEDLPAIKKRFRELLRGIIHPAEFRLVTRTGQPRWVRVSLTPVFEGRELTGTRGILTDIDEAKWIEKENRRLQEQLQQAQKMEAIGTLAGGIAHDFNNILAAIIGYTEMALVGVEKGSPLDQNLQEVFRAGARAKDLVKQILTFSRQTEQERQPVQAKLIVKEVCKFMRASLPTTIKIKQNIHSGALVMVDPTQLYQIVLNLCTNAGQALAETGGLMEVKLTEIDIGKDVAAGFSGLRPGPYIQLSVSDTGQGIPENNLKRIFDPFFTTKEKEKGTGMGLSVVHGIVGSCGGQITVVSDAGIGSTFTVYLPTIGQAQRPDPVPKEHNETGSEHILLVDDEAALANIGKKTLASLGYRVTARTSSLEALKLFKARPDAFDLVITDMTMPGMAGDQLAREILRLKPKIPIILCSGYSSRIDQDQALALGIPAFITKPILRNEIAAAVRTVLDGGAAGSGSSGTDTPTGRRRHPAG